MFRLLEYIEELNKLNLRERSLHSYERFPVVEELRKKHEIPEEDDVKIVRNKKNYVRQKLETEVKEYLNYHDVNDLLNKTYKVMDILMPKIYIDKNTIRDIQEIYRKLTRDRLNVKLTDYFNFLDIHLQNEMAYLRCEEDGDTTEQEGIKEQTTYQDQ